MFPSILIYSMFVGLRPELKGGKGRKTIKLRKKRHCYLKLYFVYAEH